ncbi:MAG: DNA adenine methylase [Pseudomonadota bacterium]
MMDGTIDPIVTRPALRWHGGKWRIAPWIISHFPPHRSYVEPFGGAASVLLRKPVAQEEVYNDLFDEVVTLFRVLRSEWANELIAAVALTPFSRLEFERAYQFCDCEVETARRLIVRSFFGYGGGLSINRQATGFRSVNKKAGSAPQKPWAGYPEMLRQIVERLRGVIIESQPAMDLIAAHDSPDTLFYIDPPYPHDTRSGKTSGGSPYHRYPHEMSDGDHVALLRALRDVEGFVVLSGYECPLYDDALADWWTRTREVRADGGQARVEKLWINYDPAAVMPEGGLFGGVT